MKTVSQRYFLQLVAIAVAGIALSLAAPKARAATAEDLDREAHEALQLLYKKQPVAKDVGKSAKAILVFPKIIKAGLVFGGSYGEGVLLKGGKESGFYNSVSASWGWQAGAQSYGYAVFLMTDKAVEYLEKSKGWEFGVGPTVVAVNEGVAQNLSTTTAKEDAYGFIFDQQGLMASLSLEGTKVSRIKPKP